MVRIPTPLEMRNGLEKTISRRRSTPILLYHKITRRFGMGGVWNTPGQFRRQMEYLYSRGFKTLPIEGAFRDREESGVIITFDDGYEGIYEYAYPVMRELGFTASIFIITDYVGGWNGWDVNLGRKFRHLSWSQIKEMQGEGFSFHSHTRTHPNLTWLGERRLDCELRESKIELEQKLGVPVDYLSYPFGRYNERVKRAAEEAGYAGCFASCRKPNCGQDRFAMKREGMYITDGLWDLKAKIMGRDSMSRGYQNLKGRVIGWFARGTYAVKRLRQT